MNFKILFFIILIIFTAIASYKATYAFLTSNQIISGNTITTASISPTPTIPITSTPSPTPISIADHVVISEVQIATSASALGDFIELYNPTSSPVVLSNHRLVKRTGGSTDTDIKAFSSSDIIPAHGYYLWASSDNGYNLQINADVATSENIAADNSIALRNGPTNTGTIIDAVGWGTLTGTPLTEGTALSNPSADQSLERKALSTSTASSMADNLQDGSKGNGFDSNDNSVDFILRTSSQPQNSSSPTESP